jgi:pantoate kinase
MQEMNIPLPVGFSPASVTCFFSPSIGSSGSNSSSRGCAINLEKGVKAYVEAASSTEIFFNGISKSIAPVEYVVRRLSPEPLKISLESSLPLGCGFGISAASCLSAALVIAKRYELTLSRTELGNVAHEAEVIYKTGLGDVASQLCGGIVYRRCEKGPLDSEQLAVNLKPIYFKIFEELETAEILNNPALVKMVTEKGAVATQWLRENIASLTLADILSHSLTFAQDAGLITNNLVASCIADVLLEGGHATMIMLGQGVMSTLPVGDTSQWISCNIDKQGTRYIGAENGHSL